MKTYIGVKVVQAEPMTEHVFKSKFKNEDVAEGSKDRLGYHLLYPNDYHSWSPKFVFDEAYREMSAGEIKLLPVPGVKDFAEARKTMSVHLNQDEDLKMGYQSNIAMYLNDQCNITNHDERNEKAKELLKLIFS